MLLKIKQMSRRRKRTVIIIAVTLYLFYTNFPINSDPNTSTKYKYKNESISPKEQFIIEEKRLKRLLKYDKGMGCTMPVIDPFSKEVTNLEKNATPITCKGEDWVKCYHSECRVLPNVLDLTRSIVCTYRDIIYVNDNNYVLGTPVAVHGDKPYVLIRSDHVQIRCKGTRLHTLMPTKWNGLGAGFRKNVPTPSSPLPVKKDSPNVLIFGYDCLSRNAHIRRMPKTYKYITEELKLTILEKYNIVGDGTTAALFPILSGVTESEIPDARRRPNHFTTIESRRFIFHKVKQHGYRTAYFEDMPIMGTFQLRFNGFDVQPADHFLRAFFQEDYKRNKNFFCLGSTLTYRLMMNLTDQFLGFSNSKRFILNFIGNVGHEDFDVIAQVDVATMEYLKSFKAKGYTKDTLLIFMGDHGPRYAELRKTLQGRLEERLPLMAILLPENLRRTRPSAQEALELNSRVLTTPHDIHATLLDALDLTQYTIDYKIPGADFPRGMSLLKPIPRNRSCSEAGINPHWCVCASRRNVLTKDVMYYISAQALLDFINDLTEPVRSYCAPRTLTSIEWVMMLQENKIIREFTQAADETSTERETYEVQLTAGPGTGIFEATFTYMPDTGQFSIDSRDISRINKYNDEPNCIKFTHPHLLKFCYCKN